MCGAVRLHVMGEGMDVDLYRWRAGLYDAHRHVACQESVGCTDDESVSS